MRWFPAREPGHADTQSATNSPWAPRYNARHTMMCRSEPSSRRACVGSGPDSPGEHSPETGGSTPLQSCVGVFQESQLLENPWQTLKSTNTLGVQDFHLPAAPLRCLTAECQAIHGLDNRLQQDTHETFRCVLWLPPQNQTTPKPVMVTQLLFIC